jgi:outer membrane immunogenic protein
MKKVLLTGTALLTLVSGSAMAADLSRPPPAPAPVYTKAPMMPAFTWTGCYLGGNAGGLWAKKDWNNTALGAESSASPSGGLAGGQIGCNYQVSAWVFGVQGDYDWTNANGSATDSTFIPAGSVSDQTTIKGLASVTGRAGYAWDRFLLYAKGGGAWVKDDYNASGAGFSNTATETRTGWTIGGGGEYAFTNWLTGFVEYNYYDFGTKTNTLSGTLAAPFSVDIKQTVSVAKAGLNFKFGGW